VTAYCTLSHPNTKLVEIVRARCPITCNTPCPESTTATTITLRDRSEYVVKYSLDFMIIFDTSRMDAKNLGFFLHPLSLILYR
jgi:hypothetical protein